MNKAELLEIMRSARAEWDELLSHVGAARMDEPGVEGTWSARDVIAHISAYERWTGANVLAELRGETPTRWALYGRDAEYLESETSGEDDYNAWVVEYNRTRPLDEVLSEHQLAFEILLDAIVAVSEADLDDPQRFTFLGGRSLSHALPNQSFAHYRMHEPSIRAWLEKTGDT